MTTTDSVLVPVDTLSSSPDSLSTQKILKIKFKLDTIRYNLFGTSDSMRHLAFTQTDIIHINYNGFADVFRNKALYQVFDFIEMGQPRYVSALHLMPHQTAMFYEGHLLNDPLSGLYNTRFLALDAVETVEGSAFANGLSTNGQSLLNGINVNGRFQNPESPYSRLMFRQGDFGFTELDIQFARKMNDQLSIQLSGINKYNDLNNHHGVNYRGTINYQFSPMISSRTTYKINDEELSIFNYDSLSSFAYKERRDELLHDLTWYCNSQKTERWHLKAGFTGNRRSNTQAEDSIKVKYRFERMQFSVDRNLKTGSMDWLAGMSLFQNQVWGNALSKDFTDSGADGFISLNYPMFNAFYLKPVLRWQYLYGESTFFTPSLNLSYNYKSGINLNAIYRQDIRRPNRNELSFSYASYRGNNQLKAERMNSLIASAEMKLLDKIQFSMESGYRKIENEIVFSNPTFYNDEERSFAYFSIKTQWQAKLFNLSLGGQASNAEILLAPKNSFWLRAGYHDMWLNGALTIDASGTMYGYNSNNTIHYNPVVERFYWTSDQTNPYLLFSYKIVVTVKDAQLYVAMDNPLSTEYEIISGYPEFYRRVRFGFNWVFLD